jgi:hypothetical protein
MEIDIKGLDDENPRNPYERTAEASAIKFPVSMKDWPKQIVCKELAVGPFIKGSAHRNLRGEEYAVRYYDIITRQAIVVFNT